MYALGLGTDQDFVLAYMWATLAADEEADYAEQNRAGIADRLSAEQIAEARRLAAEWMPLGLPPDWIAE